MKKFSISKLMTNQELLEKISVYLPYNVKVKYFDPEREKLEFCNIHFVDIDEITLTSPDSDYHLLLQDDHKLVLKPLSMLTEEIEHEGERFVPIVEMLKPEINITKGHLSLMGKTIVWQQIPILNIEDMRLSLKQFNYLHSLHFDTGNLISSGHAISWKEVYK